MIRAGLALTVLTAAVCASMLSAASGRPLPGAPKCPIFPPDNHWNQRIDRLPVHPNSGAIVRSIGLDQHVHADFGSGLWEGGPIGIPFTTVNGGHARVAVSFEYGSESDGRRYPLPRDAPIEGGRGGDGDRHVIVVDRSRCRLYELFAAYPQDGGARWSAGSGAIWNLRSNRLRPRGWTCGSGATTRSRAFRASHASCYARSSATG